VCYVRQVCLLVLRCPEETRSKMYEYE
jgi:hypothetical protein